MPLLSHIDLRVRDRRAAARFYSPVLGALGVEAVENEEWTSFGFPSERRSHWFGYTESADVSANGTRVAFTAATREQVDAVAGALRELKTNFEGPDEEEGYYAIFFSDPDGNKLEVAYTADR